MDVQRKIEGHRANCCKEHGCKYSDELCPVVLGYEKQDGPCFECREDKTEIRPDVDVFIENIASGTCDPYLEAILAAAHGRKRALRNVTRPYGKAEL